MPKVSIIVPVYNSENVIGRCIESILNQTYKDFELILINDGSIDNSLVTITKYAESDNRIRVIDNKNKGVSETRNEGIKLAVGEYIQFVDSDDYIEEDMIEKNILTMENIKPDLIITGVYIDIENENNISTQVQTFNYYEAKGNKEIGNAVLQRLDGTYIQALWNKIYKRKIIVDYDIKMDSNISLGEDLIFNLEYLKHCDNVIFDNKPYYHYLIKSNDSLTAKYRQDKLEIMYLLHEKCEEYLEFCNINYKERKKLNAIFIKSIYSAFNDLNHSDCKLKLKEKIEFVKKTYNKYKSIIDNTENLSLMNKILKIGLKIPILGFLLSKVIFFIKTKFRNIFYKK